MSHYRIDVGKRIKEYRQKHNLTLKEIEARVDVSATHVSEIERGKTSPTIGALSKIADALEVPTALFLTTDDLPHVHVTRKGDGRRIHYEREHYRVEALSGCVPAQDLSVGIIEWEPTSEDGPVRRHQGEEFGIILEGALEIQVGAQVFEVKEGESIHFRADQPHRITNRGDAACRTLWACWPKLGV